MNKKHSILIIFIFFSSTANFAGQEKGVTPYSSIINAYKHGNKYFKGIADNTDIPTIQAHKQELEERKKSIESSYMPVLINVIAGILGLSSFGMGYYAWQGAGASQDLFKRVPTVFELGFLAHMKYSTKNALGLKNDIVSRGKNEITQYLVKSPEQQKIVEAGVAAVPLGAGSLISAALSLYLFKKAASYKEELAQIEENIKIDEDMLEILRQ